MEDNNGLKKIKSRLYKKDTLIDKRTERGSLETEKKEVETDWIEKEEEDFKKMPKPTKTKKKLSIFWIIFSVFILLAVSAVAFLYYFVGFSGFGAKIVSSRNIDLAIEGPLVVESGERNRWYISITNNNDANLELADLIIKYPKGALSLQSEEVEKERRALGEIIAGETVREELIFFILGKEEEEKTIEITLEYRITDSNAIFAKDIKQTIKLSRSPIGVSVKLPKEIGVNQEFVLEVEYVSNSESLLKDLYLKMDYPPGFEFIESSLNTFKGNNVWKIGDLMPQEKRTLEIRGKLEGQDLMELTFHGSVGSLKEGRDLEAFITSSNSVVLRKSVFDLAFLVGGGDISHTSTGSQLNFSIPWQNNSPVEIRNAVINVKLEGDVIDSRTVSVKKGFYRGFDNLAVWNSSSLPELKSIYPGNSGVVELSFNLKKDIPVTTASEKNFVFVLQGEMTGTKIDEDGQIATVKSNISKEIKINSEIEIAADLLHSSGPLPPRVGQENVYTVSWSVSNFYNDVSGAVVRASLPSYVSWIGSVSPSGENVMYSPSAGEIVWSIGDIKAGTGLSSPPKKVTFQISFLPSLNQLDSTIDLVTRASFEGRDNFTGSILRDLTKILTTGSIKETTVDSSLGIITQ